MKAPNTLLVIPALLLFTACDKGIAPPAAAPSPNLNGSFSGTVTFLNWIAADTLYDLRLIAFTVFPPADVIDEVLQGRAVVHPPLGAGLLAMEGADSVVYQLQLAAGTYPYVVVAQQFGPDLFADWKPVGQYDLDSNLTDPSPVVITAGQNVPGIHIKVDFANPPPIP
ncbi:MAG: hypothetical protein OEV30_08500 [Ignavibacteria bacterium]|nr:hypothetical protein [Ignavibacteria bacterium]